MVMRYHWGLGVGHIYTHHDDAAPSTAAAAIGSSSLGVSGKDSFDHDQLQGSECDLEDNHDGHDLPVDSSGSDSESASESDSNDSSIEQEVETEEEMELFDMFGDTWERVFTSYD
jgi:hypothetical protein